MLSAVVDSERCYYTTVINIPVVKCNETVEKEFLISIYCELRRTYVEITIVPKRVECESYSIYIKRKYYKELSKAQDFLVEFRDFPRHLRSLFNEYEDGKLKLQIIFDIDNTIELEFYVIHDAKKQTILKLPLVIYLRPLYLQAIHNDLEWRFELFFNRCKMLQERVKEHNRRHQEMKASLVVTHERKKLEPQDKFKSKELKKEKQD